MPHLSPERWVIISLVTICVIAGAVGVVVGPGDISEEDLQLMVMAISV